MRASQVLEQTEDSAEPQNIQVEILQSKSGQVIKGFLERLADLVGTGLRRKPLWVPSGERVKQANLTRFLALVNKKYSLSLGSYPELYGWSIQKPTEFWSAMWDYAGIISSKKFEAVVDDLSRFPGAKWFSGARLNFAENLLRFRDERIALISRSEGRGRSSLTYSDLYRKVVRVANGLRETGVRAGDRVAGYLSNIEEAAIAMLAATSIGAVWAGWGAELGSGAVLDRLGQIKPKILLVVDGYVYKGKKFDISSNVNAVADGIPSLEKIVTVPHLDVESGVGQLVNSVRFDEFGSANKSGEIRFEQLPSDHPVLVMFTSGTTGKPKCMVQGAAGVLVNQLKETQLHADLKNTDRITYITSPSWMMWNWLMSCLAAGATLILYDGNPLHPDWGTMRRRVQEEKITILGCSASYINHLRGIGAKPSKDYDLSSLREISQTGSPLSTEGLEWGYKEVKADLHLNSISGGMEIK